MIDAALAHLAAAQHGVGARWQFERLGITQNAIRRRVQSGRLHRLHRGVYAIGHTSLTRRSRWMAAVLRVGPDAALSLHSAAPLWGVRPGRGGPIHVSCPRRVSSLRGIVVHQAPLPADEVTTHDGIPVTTVPRTLLDLAAELTDEQLAWALNEAEVQRLHDALSLPVLIDRYPGRRGVRRARRVLAAFAGPRLTRSQLERAFLDFLLRHGLPMPATNAQVTAGGRRYECDFVWHDRRVIVELDGYDYHSSRHMFHADRRRDRALKAARWETVRVTEWDLRGDEASLRSDLRSVLGLLDSVTAPA
jgi:very-short-patch-repair endonuclease